MLAHLRAEGRALRQFGHHGVHLVGQPCLGHDDIVLHYQGQIRAHDGRVGAQRVAQFFQDAPDFPLLILLQIEDVVVDFDDRFRLDEGRAPRGRFVVDDAPDFALMLHWDGQHPTVVPNGFHVVGQPAGVAVTVDEGAEDLVEFPLLAPDFPPDGL